VFTGIVEEVGRVRGLEKRGNGVVLDIAARRVCDDLAPGASIAIQGVCQTVLAHDPHGFRVAAEAETLRVTTLGTLRAGHAVNLERALLAGGRFDGHIVLGHVDGRGRVCSVRVDGQTRCLEIEVPEALRPYVVPKGCIAVDGVSLTVGPQVRDGRFELFLIPYTWENTALQGLAAGGSVNIETDILGRYVAHLLGRSGAPTPAGLDWDMLARAFGKGANG
jgi:riboflavin synthase